MAPSVFIIILYSTLSLQPCLTSPWLTLLWNCPDFLHLSTRCPQTLPTCPSHLTPTPTCSPVPHSPITTHSIYTSPSPPAPHQMIYTFSTAPKLFILKPLSVPACTAYLSHSCSSVDSQLILNTELFLSTWDVCTVVV